MKLALSSTFATLLTYVILTSAIPVPDASALLEVREPLGDSSDVHTLYVRDLVDDEIEARDLDTDLEERMFVVTHGGSLSQMVGPEGPAFLLAASGGVPVKGDLSSPA